MTMPLEGVRIVDLTMVWAGPFGTRLAGDYGAEVIKVEAPKQWDQLRGLGQLPRSVPKWYNKSAYFNHNNRNKYGLALDLRQAEGRDLLLKLCAESDVIVENYRADVMDNLGLSYDEVRAVNPQIIYVSMPGHGKNGPESTYVAYGTNVEQVAGLVSLSGYEDGEPMKTGFSYGDPVAGIAFVAAVAMALRQRRMTGEGLYVELAQRENLTAFVGEFLVDFSMNGVERKPIGNQHALYSPHNRYPCAGHDSWLTVACESTEQFAKLGTVIGREDFETDERFATVAGRRDASEEIDAAISDWTSQRGHYEAMHILQGAGVPAGAVLTIPELMTDPQLRTRDAWREQTHPDAGTWKMEAPPWKLSRTPGNMRLPTPGFGEHNSYVFRDILGLDEDAIAGLYARGVTSDEPDAALHS